MQYDTVCHTINAVSDDWSRKVDWMRHVGALSADWDYEGRLRRVQLGPAPHRDTDLRPPPPVESTDAHEHTVDYDGLLFAAS